MKGTFLRLSGSLAAIFLIVTSCLAELPIITVHFSRNGVVQPTQYTLEVAASKATRTTGLMYRNSLEGNQGMIFVWPSPQKRAFWMKNTFISLDLIFLDKNGRVQGIVESAKPLSTSHLELPGEVQSQYVIELSAGTARRNGIVAGDTVIFDEKPPVAEEDS